MENDLTKEDSAGEILSDDETSEQLSAIISEQEAVAKEILQRQKEEKLKTLLTNPSGPALSGTAREAGEDGFKRVRKTVRDLFTLYLTNQFIARAVNVRADTLISKGYNIVGKDSKGVKACIELIDNSGGINLFWQLSVNTDIAGDGFLEKVYNINGTKILKLKHVHPLTLGFRRDRFDRIILDQNNEPLGYVQFYIDQDGFNREKNVPKERIEHLKFNTLGDEFTGVSILQPGYNTAVRLMNMEYSAAEAAVRTANPLIVAECNTKSPMQIAQWGRILGRITGKDQLFVPEGMKITFMSPGQQNFSEYADYFLNAVVAATGVPRGVLLGDSGTGSNRAESIVLTRHFYSMIRSNQTYVSEFFNTIFKEYSELANFEAPTLIFEDVAEEASTSAQAAVQLFQAGIITVHEAREMIGLEVSAEDDKKTVTGNEDAVKKSNMETAFPETPGKPAGSQTGIKRKQKVDPNSLVSPTSK